MSQWGLSMFIWWGDPSRARMPALRLMMTPLNLEICPWCQHINKCTNILTAPSWFVCKCSSRMWLRKWPSINSIQSDNHKGLFYLLTIKFGIKIIAINFSTYYPIDFEMIDFFLMNLISYHCIEFINRCLHLPVDSLWPNDKSLVPVNVDLQEEKKYTRSPRSWVRLSLDVSV